MIPISPRELGVRPFKLNTIGNMNRCASVVGFAIACQCIISVLHQMPDRKVFNIDKLLLSEDGVALIARCVMKLETTRRVDFEDYIASDIEVVVDLRRKGEDTRILRRSFDARLESAMATRSPLWDNGFVDTNFILPSAKFIQRGNEVFLVIFNREGFEGFQLSLDDGEAVSIDLTNHVYRDVSLAASRLFDPSDIYWSFGVVRYGQTLGARSASIDFAKTIDGEYLWSLWKMNIESERK